MKGKKCEIGSLGKDHICKLEAGKKGKTLFLPGTGKEMKVSYFDLLEDIVSNLVPLMGIEIGDSWGSFGLEKKKWDHVQDQTLYQSWTLRSQKYMYHKNRDGIYLLCRWNCRLFGKELITRIEFLYSSTLTKKGDFGIFLIFWTEVICWEIFCRSSKIDQGMRGMDLIWTERDVDQMDFFEKLCWGTDVEYMGCPEAKYLEDDGVYPERH